MGKTRHIRSAELLRIRRLGKAGRNRVSCGSLPEVLRVQDLGISGTGEESKRKGLPSRKDKASAYAGTGAPFAGQARNRKTRCFRTCAARFVCFSAYRHDAFCRQRESNPRHKDFQSFALPTELQRQDLSTIAVPSKNVNKAQAHRAGSAVFARRQDYLLCVARTFLPSFLRKLECSPCPPNLPRIPSRAVCARGCRRMRPIGFIQHIRSFRRGIPGSGIRGS